MGRTRQSRRMSTGSARPMRLPPPPPPTYDSLRRAGGETGPRTPEERAFIIKDFVSRAYGQGRLDPPQWFKQRFPVYPAYKVTAWECSFINGDPGFVTRALFERHLRQVGGPDQEEFWAEKAAYTAVETTLASFDEDFLISLLGSRKGYSPEEWCSEPGSEDEDGDSKLSEHNDD
eukprot:jgi/Botrbrau1/10414/Bobra.0133s0023.1